MAFLKNLNSHWTALREFAYENRTIFEMFFIFIYAFEQTALIISTFIFKNTEELSLIISIFAVLVLTTFALHKLVMESIIKSQQKELTEIKKEINSLTISAKEAISNYDELLNIFNRLFSQGLNIPKSFLYKKKVKK